MTPAALAAAMRQQAETGASSRRQLPGGLIVRYAKTGDTCTLTLARQHPGPTQREREQWRAAFRVNPAAFEYRAVEGEYVMVSVEWREVGNVRS